jgi:hypothetical protein
MMHCIANMLRRILILLKICFKFLLFTYYKVFPPKKIHVSFPAIAYIFQKGKYRIYRKVSR